MLSDSITHGFLPNAGSPDLISDLNIEIKALLADYDFPTYISGLEEHIPLSLRVITPDIETLVGGLLCSEAINLMSVELHYLPPHSDPIPPHQDNFYHCIEGGEGLKLLFPLTELTHNNGGLFFLDCPSSVGILRHIPSTVNNFSSYLPESAFSCLDYSWSSYHYLPGDASFHLLNSIHYSNGNRSQSSSAFIVYRFQDSSVTASPALLRNYEEVYRLHSQSL